VGGRTKKEATRSLSALVERKKKKKKKKEREREREREE